jgi:hypothetical protein
MIHINCTNCRATLQIDDAFAGGVCRCQHCGTIQTVPAHLKGNAPDTPAATGELPPAYQSSRGGGTGLDELSDAVISSGLARSGLRSKSKSGGGGLLDAPGAVGGVGYATPARKPPATKPPVALIVIGCGLALAAVAAVAWLLFGSFPTTRTQTPPGPVIVKDANPTRGGGKDEERIVVPKAAHFCGVDLSGSTGVVYLLDRGSASAALFDSLTAATFNSIGTLGPGRKFAVVFWQTGNSPVAAYPAKGLTPATPQNIDAAGKAFEDVIAHGRSEPLAAIQDAGPRGASDVIFVTAKSDDVPDAVVSAIGKAFAGKRVHTFALGEDAGGPLKSIADQHRGAYRLLTSRELDVFSAPR